MTLVIPKVILGTHLCRQVPRTTASTHPPPFLQHYFLNKNSPQAAQLGMSRNLYFFTYAMNNDKKHRYKSLNSKVGMMLLGQYMDFNQKDLFDVYVVLGKPSGKILNIQRLDIY